MDQPRDDDDLGSDLGDSIAGRVISLARALQAAGAAVSLAEIVDATQASLEIDIVCRSELREALRATLVKDVRVNPLFDLQFEQHFPVRPLAHHTDLGDRSAGTVDLVHAMATGDGLEAAAAGLVDAYGGLDGLVRTERYHVQRVMHGADIARLMSRVRAADPNVAPAELRARLDELKRAIAIDVRVRVNGAAPAIEPDVRDIAFLDASRAELDEMRRAIKPIARQLAARVARRRRHRAGRANFRRTMRQSLATGGIPVDVAFDRRRAHKPELFVLCDISGSVADFSVFTLTLMSALSAELARTRSFVFVDGVDEVTSLLRASDHGIEPWQLMRNTAAITGDGHTDHGAVFEQFWTDVAQRDVTPATTLLITGDARTNHRPNGVDWLGKVAARARKVYWLNPESRSEWNTHDSAVDDFAAVCHGTFEVRNLRQLVDCVERLI